MKDWWSISELVELGHSSLPRSARRLRDYASRNCWDKDRNRCREVEAQGGAGGLRREYHISLLPPVLQALIKNEDILTRNAAQDAEEDDADRRDTLWSHYWRATAKAKERAEQHRAALEMLDELARHTSIGEAVLAVSLKTGVAVRTLHRLRKKVAGHRKSDWLAVLTPRRGGGPCKVAVHPEALRFICSDYARPEEPSFQSCYDRLEDVAATEGWGELPARSTLKRHVEDTVGQTALLLARKGEEALARLIPSIERDKSMLHAMEAVNADGHVGDTMVLFPDGTVQRPIVIGFQDVYSSAVLSHRVGQTENRELIRLAAADMISTHGIPDHAYFDNGRAFMSKALTGRMNLRFRFKTKDSDPRGIFPALGTKVHAVSPYHGQSKPIERVWRVICDRVAKHPACAGAYTGNSPTNKPANYGERAVPLDVYEAVLATEIDRFNKAQGRNTKIAAGRSYADVFRESLEAPTTVVAKATTHQKRLFLLEADNKTARRPDGAIYIDGNRYWSESLIAHAGRKLIVRFDPQNLHDDLFVYEPDDSSFICRAECIEAVGFQDASGARKIAKLRADLKKRSQEALRAEANLSAAELAAKIELIGDLQPSLPVPELKVVGLNFSPDLRGPEFDAADADEAFGRGIAASLGVSSIFDHPTKPPEDD